MRILFWVPYPKEGASNRYRVEQYLPYLQVDGIQYALHPFWSKSAYRILYKKGHYLKKVLSLFCGTIWRIVDLMQIFRFDVVFVHREAYPIGGDFFEACAALLKKPIVYDFDDAIFLPVSSRQNKFIEIFKNPSKVSSIISLSVHVVAGNEYLAHFALRYNSCVSIIPTPIDTDKYRPGSVSHTGNTVIVGWMGSVTTLDFLSQMNKPLVQLSKSFPNLIFKIVGGEFSVRGLTNIISKSWSQEEELDDLMSFDIGIMPMPDNEWTNGKCGFKAISYMSMGIPCVCSSVGMNKELIKDGVNGFLVSSEEEWIQKLTLLIEDEVLRKRIGLAGRVTVEEKYSVKVNAPKLLKVFRSVHKKNSKEPLRENSYSRAGGQD